MSYADLAPPAVHSCASSAEPGGGNFMLRCPTCTPALAAPAPAPAAAAQPYCNGTQHLTAATGSFTDGAPPGSPYAPGSLCTWVIDPGYRFVHPCFCMATAEQLRDSEGLASNGSIQLSEHERVPLCRPVRLNFSQFGTEAGYDFVWILRLDDSGFQDVLQQLSGGFYQASHPQSPHTGFLLGVPNTSAKVPVWQGLAERHLLAE